MTLFDSSSRRARPDGCEARIVSRSGTGAISGPCGVALEVAFSDAIAWIERPSEVTPYVTDVSEGGVFVLDRFVAAGTATFSAEPKLSSGQRLWLVAFGGPVGKKVFQHPVDDPTRPQRVPAGRMVAVVLDDHDRALRMSPLVRIPYRSTVHVQPERAVDGGNLIAFIGAPAAPDGVSDVQKVWASDAKGVRPPDALVPGSDGIVAVWYGLAGPVKVEVASSSLWLPNADLHLGSRDIAVLRERLRRLPKLTVAIGKLDDDSRATPKMELSLKKIGDDAEVVRTLAVAPGSVHVLEALAPARYDLVVRVSDFELRAEADLSSGDDVRVEMPLEPITISGTVYRGRFPVQAELRFLQRGAAAVVKTAEDGSYSATIWRPQRYFVDVVPFDDPARPPFREMLRIVADRQVDFVIPDKKLGARIFDAESGKPIAGAAISLRSSYHDASGRKAHDVLSFRSGEQAVTELPPQREGTAELNVRAEGYENAGPVTVPIDAAGGVAIVDVSMVRIDGDDGAIEVRLPGSRPAAGAEMTILSGGALLPWNGVAGADGLIRVPDDVLEGNYLLIRHREGASTILPYASRGSISIVELLPPAPALLLRVTGPDGLPIGPQGARMTIWLGDVRLSGAAVAFLTWSAALTSTGGSWLAKNLPARELVVLATRSAAAAKVDGGHFDGFAATVAYPWPAAPSIRLSE